MIIFCVVYFLIIVVIIKDYVENDSGFEYIGFLFGFVCFWDGFMFF